MAKVALLIGVGNYRHPDDLKPLVSAPKDVAAMQRILLNPQMGEFSEVIPLIDPDPMQMQEAIETLYRDRARDDLVLLFFSGHGIKDDSGKLYFSTRLTRKTLRGELVRATAVPAHFVQQIMGNSRSRRQVMILDCCFSGAFDPALNAKDDGSLDMQGQLGAEGRVVLTSSSSTEFSFEQHGSELSIYTRFLVEGIETGAADQDNDGKVSVRELHEYATKKVRETAPTMNPKIIVLKNEGFDVVFAKAHITDPKLKYRKEAERYSMRGEISEIGKVILNKLRVQLGLTPEETQEIGDQVLQPFRERLKNLEDYRSVFVATVERQYPLTPEILSELKDLQKILGLRDEDVTAIEAPLLASKQTENERQQAELAAQELVAQRQPSPPLVLPKVTYKKLDECDSSKLLYLKNVKDPSGWAYTLERIQEMGGSVESRVFELSWSLAGKGVRLASKDDLMILNQQAKVTHVVEILDDEVRENEWGYSRWVRVVWMPQEADWYQLPHQKEILGFEPPRFGGGTAHSFVSPGFGKFHAAWSNLQDFQQHVFQLLSDVDSPTLGKVDEDDLSSENVLNKG